MYGIYQSTEKVFSLIEEISRTNIYHSDDAILFNQIEDGSASLFV